MTGTPFCLPSGPVGSMLCCRCSARYPLAVQRIHVVAPSSHWPVCGFWVRLVWATSNVAHMPPSCRVWNSMLPVFPLMVSVTWLMVAMMVFLSLRVMAVLFSGGGPCRLPCGSPVAGAIASVCPAHWLVDRLMVMTGLVMSGMESAGGQSSMPAACMMAARQPLWAAAISHCQHCLLDRAMRWSHMG